MRVWISQAVKYKVAARNEWMCSGTCGERLKWKHEIDHIISVADGGTSEESNLQALCPRCHAEKTGQWYVDRYNAKVRKKASPYFKPRAGRGRRQKRKFKLKESALQAWVSEHCNDVVLGV